jgi:hypothetical protein
MALNVVGARSNPMPPSFSLWQKTQFGHRVTMCDAWRDVWKGMVLLWWRIIGVGGHAGDRAQLDPDTIWD